MAEGEDPGLLVLSNEALCKRVLGWLHLSEELCVFLTAVSIYNDKRAFAVSTHMRNLARRRFEAKRFRYDDNARGENVVQAEEDNRRDVEIPEEDWVLPEFPKLPEFPEFPTFELPERPVPDFPRIPEFHEFPNLDFLELPKDRPDPMAAIAEQHRTEADLRRFLGE